MSTLTRTQLDSRVFDFARDYLSDCGALGRGLVERLAANEFDVWAYLPRSCPEPRRYAFSHGGLHLDSEEDGSPLLHDARDMLVSDLLERMKTDVDACLVTEIVMARPGDAWLEASHCSPSFYAEGDVYMSARSPVSAEALANTIRVAEDLPWCYGVLSVCDGDRRGLAPQLEPSDIEQLISGTRCLYLGAYDLESFVVFERTE